MLDRRQVKAFRFIYTLPKSGNVERTWTATILAFDAVDAERHLVSRVKFPDIDQREDVGNIDAFSDAVVDMVVENYNYAHKKAEEKEIKQKREMSKK